MSKIVYLSHVLTAKTPSYGNKSSFQLEQTRSFLLGDHVNETVMHFPAHLGTHIDMPLHFYKEGQSILDYDADFWCFSKPLLVEVFFGGSSIIHQELIDTLTALPLSSIGECDLLMVKTWIGEKRALPEFWQNNPGFSPELYDFFNKRMPALRVLGFDSISLSGFQHRDIGKVAHQAFLNPNAPILLLEDMNLDEVSCAQVFSQVVIAPLRVENGDGLPCTVLGWIND